MNPLITLSTARLYRDGLGVPAWGPAALLHDLELRFGLPPPSGTPPLRIRAYAARIDRAAPPFLTAAFAADRLGASAAVLELRDSLVDAGWDGREIPGGGDRLAAISAIEAQSGPPLPPGPADRLLAVERHLRGPIYDSVTLLPEERDLWPARWRRVLQRAAAGLRTWEPDFPLASPGTDLRRVQDGARGPLDGDGSVLILRAPTSLELAEAVAAEVAAVEDLLIIRDGDPAALDLALQAHGLPALGDDSPSASLPLLQLLPLTLDLSFAPKDPRGAIDLLLLPGGPFDRSAGHRLAAILSQYPSVTSRRWIEARSALRTEDAALVQTWLEAPGSPPDAAPVDALLARLGLVQAHLQGSRHPAAAIAAVQTRELEEALRAHPRPAISRHELRALLQLTGRRAACPLSVPWAGRAEHLDDPRLALRAHPHVIWWCFTDHPPAAPLTWCRAERRALAAAGLALPDTGALFAARAEGWRRALMAATRRLLLAVPGSIAGARTAPHPLWDELRGRLGLDASGEARITLHPVGPRLLPPRALPAARAEWAAPPDLLVARTRSPKSLQALLECPLKWTFEHQAKLTRREVASMPDRRALEGFLAHRLAEELVQSGVLAQGPAAVAGAVPDLLQRLIAGEASHLHLPGMSFDLQAITRMLHHAVDALAHLVQQAQLTDLRAEQPLPDVTTWRNAPLTGRTDLTAVAPGRGRVVIDLKRRSANRLRETLRRGRAIQLAAYAFALDASSAYFSITNATLLTTNPAAFGLAYANAGPTDQVTWSRAGATLDRVESVLAQGRIPVTGLEVSPELQETLGVAKEEADRHLVSSRRQVQDEVCGYCAFAAVCGRQWEELS
jgi:PD-(D/E)XK nuclease superfamily protein